MLPKVKAQKTRLNKFLTQELGATYKKSESSNSEYFEINTIRIRISDHTTRKNNEYLNIFIPFNDPNSFIIEYNYTISILKSLKEVKTFLHSLLYIQDLYRDSLNESYEEKISKQSDEIEKLREEIESLRLANYRYKTMIDTRNKAIVELSKRAKEAEELALSDPQNVVKKRAKILNSVDITEDSILLKGKIYPLQYFDQSFKNKINNIIESNTHLKAIKYQ